MFESYHGAESTANCKRTNRIQKMRVQFVAHCELISSKTRFCVYVARISSILLLPAPLAGRLADWGRARAEGIGDSPFTERSALLPAVSTAAISARQLKTKHTERGHAYDASDPECK